MRKTLVEETLTFHDLLRPHDYGSGEYGYILGVHDSETKVDWGPNLKILFCATLSKGNILYVDGYLDV